MTHDSLICVTSLIHRFMHSTFIYVPWLTRINATFMNESCHTYEKKAMITTAQNPANTTYGYILYMQSLCHIWLSHLWTSHGTRMQGKQWLLQRKILPAQHMDVYYICNHCVTHKSLVSRMRHMCIITTVYNIVYTITLYIITTVYYVWHVCHICITCVAYEHE